MAGIQVQMWDKPKIGCDKFNGKRIITSVFFLCSVKHHHAWSHEWKKISTILQLCMFNKTCFVCLFLFVWFFVVFFLFFFFAMKCFSGERCGPQASWLWFSMVLKKKTWLSKKFSIYKFNKKKEVIESTVFPNGWLIINLGTNVKVTFGLGWGACIVFMITLKHWGTARFGSDSNWSETNIAHNHNVGSVSACTICWHSFSGGL